MDCLRLSFCSAGRNAIQENPQGPPVIKRLINLAIATLLRLKEGLAKMRFS